MRKLTAAVLGVIVSACLAQAGHAQEKRKRASGSSQATTTTTNWNGLQTGANGGNSSLAQNFAEPGAFLCPTFYYYAPACVETDFRFSGRPSSLTLGGFTGYRVQIGNMVIGVEGDLAWKKATTALVFDTGVYLVVVGLGLGILTGLGEGAPDSPASPGSPDAGRSTP